MPPAPVHPGCVLRTSEQVQRRTGHRPGGGYGLGIGSRFNNCCGHTGCCPAVKEAFPDSHPVQHRTKGEDLTAGCPPLLPPARAIWIEICPRLGSAISILL